MSKTKKKSILPQWALVTASLTLLAPSPVSVAQELPPAAPSSAASPLANLPLRELEPTFRQLGQGSSMMLRGVESEGNVNISIRRDELVESALLRLTFTLSPALIPSLSHIKILLNEELLQTVSLTKEQLGTPQHVELPIDARLFTDYNRLRFQFIGHYTMDCEMPNHTSLWAAISNESQLSLKLRQLPLSNDLALLPAPFFDARDNQTVNVPIVVANAGDMGQLRAAGSVASWLGMLAGYRGNRFPIFENQLPQRHAIVFATNEHRPDFLKEQPAVTQPTLTMMSHPEHPTVKLLVVQGKDDAQLQQAADALALGKAALTGSSMQVTKLEYPEKRKAYDAPRWLTTKRPVLLSELVDNPSDLQLRGYALNNTINIPARMAPDLFSWKGRGVPLQLNYRYTPNSVSQHGSLSLSINDQFIKAYPLQAADDDKSGRSTIMLPLFEDGSTQTSSDFRIPSFLVGGDNQLQLGFQLPAADLGRCRSTQPTELRAAIDPESSIDLRGFRHYLPMPNLAAYANSGYPFTKYADLSQTSVVLPNHPTAADAEAYLTAMARMSAATGLAGVRFSLLNADQIEKARDTDILLVSAGDKDGLLQKWSQDIPTLISAGKRTTHLLERAIGSLSELFQHAADAPTPATTGLATLEGEGPLAAIVGFESPLHKGRSIVGLTASDDAAMGHISRGLSDSTKISAMRGDLSFLRAEQVESFRVNPVYYVGDLPWWQRMWFHLHNHPLALALAGIATGLLLTFLVYGALRSLAARRLAGRNNV
ncbi:cellulose biosynthesis cyclic di-GMP-binding regulatory protein BcsB [Comamonas sp. w2-DMI]|uniref:cellulose biosynthesis cyclic di-GMP-binding regulatory protein BcsB n=1 Tax=Comamonas sp. w2-DMI TaxID=3126391 RepID=UPI0032E47A68